MTAIHEHAILRAIAGGGMNFQTAAGPIDLGKASGDGPVVTGKLAGMLSELDRLSTEGWEVVTTHLHDHYWTVLMRRVRGGSAP